MISGLGGAGTSWGPQIDRFARGHFVILPDQRGTGRSTHTDAGCTTHQPALDMISLVEHLGLDPVHVIGASTGGAIAQHLALPGLVRTLTLSSSFARFDPFMRREFEIRRKITAQWDRFDTLSAHSLFLFSPRFTHQHPERVAEWIKNASAIPTGPDDRAIGLKRIGMIAAHDASARLDEMTQPTLVLCGDNNHCTPMPLSEELTRGIPAAELVVFQDAGELIEIEQDQRYFEVVSSFIGL
jgi:aminoacrylate hydrolase